MLYFFWWKKLVYSKICLITNYLTTNESNDRKKQITYLLVSRAENEAREVQDLLGEVDEL